MKISLALLRIFFVILSLFFMTAFVVSLPIGTAVQKTFAGLGIGVIFSAVLFSFEMLFQRYSLKAFNTVILGLFIGYLMGQALSSICNAVLGMSHMKMVLQTQTVDLIKVCTFLLGTYLGTFLTIRFSDEILVSVPFLRFAQANQRKKDLLIDCSALSDPRLIDLATTGIIDNTLVIPRCVEKELATKAESSDELEKNKAKKCQDTLKKLESLPHLGLRFDETQFSRYDDSFSQLVRLARLSDANILTADHSQVQLPPVEGVRVLNLHALSNALKPLMATGESMTIKIQRFGKEPNQGVGYLDDGTMVVVNGGGDALGESIDVTVLSVKHTSSGRMIFCNTIDHIPSKGNHAEV